MNKKHLILPLVACLMLAGCTLGKKTSKKKKKSTSGSEISQKSEGDSSLPSEGSSGKSDSSGSSGSSTPTPGGDWSSSEKTNFQTVFHGIVPPYFSVGLDATETDLETGRFISNATTESIATGYFDSFDNTWEVTTDLYDDPIAYKDSSDGLGYVSVWLDYDESDNFYIVFDWNSPVVSLALSGTQKTQFDVGETFTYDGLVITVNYKDGTSSVVDDKATIDYYFTVSSPDMSSPGQKTVTVSYQEDETTTVSATYTINVKSTVKYTVSFDGNGATGGSMDPSQESEGDYTLPDCGFTAPEGKAFAGWKANNTGDLIPAGGTYKLDAAVTFYAQWATEYTVSFAAGDGSGTMAPVKVGEGGKISEPTCTFTAPTGKEFDKWVIGTEAVTFPYTVTGNVTLTATYKEKPVVSNVTYTIDNPKDQKGTKFSDLTEAEILSGFVSDGDAVITGFKDYNANVYFGGNGGSGATAFTFIDAFKIGKSKEKGEITLTIGSGYSFSKIAFTLCGQRDDGSITVNGVEESVTAKITGTGDLTPSTVTTQTIEFDIASGTTDFVISSKDSTENNYSIYIVGIQFIA